ncbi:THAP domain-containing protein 6-like [Alosa pseudoharengus]|uniref:THAP domain-containing protein 6-like n=1 Tax=Alosa pseudoharengus TaxID=34774 RepID=UPI003F8BFA83
MPDFCAAYGCSNERNKKTKEKGITFHRFPSNGERRQAWTQALRREGFVACPRSLLCSSHFRSLDFDRTGHTVRLRESTVPSIFNFPKHLSKLPRSRTSRTATKAAKEPDFFDQPATDHLYFLDPVKTKQKLTECQDQVEKLRRELRNARDRERRQKKTVQCLLDDLRDKNMLSEELQQKLDFYSDTQKILVLHALEALHERGIKVVCVTMDGHISNMSMCAKLGCQLKLNQPLKTYFTHPSSGENVYIIMDPCHMLKLARNMLEAYSSIVSPAGTVRWQHISELNNVQEREGLHAACKVTRKHVNFSSQKMKVSLAAQTLSRSVALALTMLKEAGYQQFEDCSPTVEFVQVLYILDKT